MKRTDIEVQTDAELQKIAQPMKQITMGAIKPAKKPIREILKNILKPWYQKGSRYPLAIEAGLPTAATGGAIGYDEYSRRQHNIESEKMFEKAKAALIAESASKPAGKRWTEKDFTPQKMSQNAGNVMTALMAKGWEPKRDYDWRRTFGEAALVGSLTSPTYWRKFYRRYSDPALRKLKKTDPVEYKEVIKRDVGGLDTFLNLAKGGVTSGLVAATPYYPEIGSNILKTTQGLSQTSDLATKIDAATEEIGEAGESMKAMTKEVPGAVKAIEGLKDIKPEIKLDPKITESLPKDIKLKLDPEQMEELKGSVPKDLDVGIKPGILEDIEKRLRSGTAIDKKRIDEAIAGFTASAGEKMKGVEDWAKKNKAALALGGAGALSAYMLYHIVQAKRQEKEEARKARIQAQAFRRAMRGY